MSHVPAMCYPFVRNPAKSRDGKRAVWVADVESIPSRTIVVLYPGSHQDVLHGRQALAAAVHHL